MFPPRSRGTGEFVGQRERQEIPRTETGRAAEAADCHSTLVLYKANIGSSAKNFWEHCAKIFERVLD
jgi:hypothetical protein